RCFQVLRSPVFTSRIPNPSISWSARSVKIRLSIWQNAVAWTGKTSSAGWRRTFPRFKGLLVHANQNGMGEALHRQQDADCIVECHRDPGSGLDRVELFPGFEKSSAGNPAAVRRLRPAIRTLDGCAVGAIDRRWQSGRRIAEW